MNEPLKHKLFSVYGQILNIKALNEAWCRSSKYLQLTNRIICR